MTTDPTKGEWQSPPFVSHATYPPGQHPAEPAPLPPPFMSDTSVMPSPESVQVLSSKLRRPRRSVWDWLAPVLAIPTFLAIGGGAVHLYYTEVAPPAACAEALEYADELNAQSEEYSVLVGQMLEAVFSFDQDAVAAAEAEGEAFAVRYDQALAAYESAAADCRATGGELR